MALEISVERALFAHTADLAGVQLSWPGQIEELALPFVDIQSLRSGSQRITLGGLSAYSGFLQATVVHQSDGGFLSAMTLAAQIKAHFPTDLHIGADGYQVHIYKAPDIGPAYVEGTTLRVPVSIYHRTFG